MEEREGRESESAKAKRASASSDKDLFLLLDGGEVWTGFQTGGRIRERGLNEKRIPSQRTGPVKKKKPILTPKSQAKPQPTNTHTNVNTPPDPTVFLKSHQPKPNTTLYHLYYYLHMLSVSHSLALSTANQLESRLSLSV